MKKLLFVAILSLISFTSFAEDKGLMFNLNQVIYSSATTSRDYRICTIDSSYGKVIVDSRELEIKPRACIDVNGLYIFNNGVSTLHASRIN